MTTLIEWLREQLDTDERLARAVGAGEDCHRWHWRTTEDGDVIPAEPRGNDWIAVGAWGGGLHETGDHIANWDPARVLAEVQSKRAILDVHPIETDLSEYERGLGTGQSFGCRRCADDDGVIKGEGYCRTLQALAEPYRSRPGFRKEWLDG